MFNNFSIDLYPFEVQNSKPDFFEQAAASKSSAAITTDVARNEGTLHTAAGATSDSCVDNSEVEKVKQWSASNAQTGTSSKAATANKFGKKGPASKKHALQDASEEAKKV